MQLDWLDIQAGCQGWSLESGATNADAGEVALRLPPLFRLRIFLGPPAADPAAQGYLELLRPGQYPP